MMQQKVRKPVPKAVRTAWYVLSALSLYALLFRMAWKGDVFQTLMSTTHFFAMVPACVNLYSVYRKRTQKP